MSTIIEQRESLIAELRGIKEKAAQEKRGFTSDDAKRIVKISEQINELDVKQKAAEESERLLTAIYSGAPKSGAPTAGRTGHMDLSPTSVKSIAKKIVNAAGQSRRKSIGSNLEPIPVPLVDTPILLPHQNSWAVSQLVQTRVTDGPTNYQYIRQNRRENNAAVVDPGALKPTSYYDFEEVKGKLKIFAHITDPIHEYWLHDYQDMAAAVTEELITGLRDVQEAALVNGTGVDGQPLGMLNASGILSTPFNTDALTTTRNAITTLESTGSTPGAFILNAKDWERIELARDASGRLEFQAGPVDRAQKRLWGVPVATSPTLKEGEAVLFDTSAVTVFTDNLFNITVAPMGDDFARNQLRIRAEIRSDIGILKPHGISKISLQAAA